MWTRILTLAAAISLAGCGTEQQIVGTPLPAPAAVTVTILEPVDGALLSGSTVLVRGQVGPSSNTEVTVNGETVPATAGVFAHWVAIEEGASTIQVVHPDSGATAQVSFLHDGLPPRLKIKGPPRGTSVSGGSEILLLFDASDENGLVRVEAAGQPLDISLGDWTVNVPLEVGLNTIHVEVEDSAGNVSQEHVSVMAGDFLPETANIDDALIVHMGPVGLRAFNNLVSQLADSFDYAKLLSQSETPLFDSELFSVFVTDASISPGTIVNVEAAPQQINIALTVHDLSATGELQLHTGGTTVYGMTLDIETVHIEVPLVIAANNGKYLLELLEPTFDFTSPAVTVTSGDDPIPATAGIEGAVLESIETLLVDTALQAGVDIVQALLSRLTDPIEYTFADTTVIINLTAIDVDVGSHGVELGLNGSVTVADDTEVPDDPGVLRTADETPFHPRGDTITVAISDDLLHAIGHIVWRTGVLKFTVDQTLLDGLKAPVYLVAGFLGGVTEAVGVDPEAPLVVEIGTLFPPVLSDVPNSDAAGIALGDVNLAFRTGNQALVETFVSLKFAAGAVDQGDTIQLELGPYDTAFDLEAADEDVKRSLEAGVEPFVSSLLTELSPLFSELVGAIPIPDFGPLRPQSISAGDAGTKGRWLVLSGVLVPADGD